MTIIHWFRRDLRLRDNTALQQALSTEEPLLPVFILDPAFEASARRGQARFAFLYAALHALDAALREHGSYLIVRHGNPTRELVELARETGATAAFFNRDYSPFAVQRDTAVQVALEARGVRVQSENDLLVVAPDELRTRSDKYFSVFTPYKRAWFARLGTLLPDKKTAIRLPAGITTPPDLSRADIPPPDAGLQQIPAAGEDAAHDLLAAFTGVDLRTARKPRAGAPILNYATRRNYPAEPGTSRLSVHLKYGTLSPRQAALAARLAGEQADLSEAAQKSIEGWISELAWRDFYYGIMAHYPHTVDFSLDKESDYPTSINGTGKGMRGRGRRAFKPAYNALAWENDPRLFEAWCAGRTGYPLIDAAMRQMHTEAWMHNRMRMIVASFLSKDLLVDWRWGERYFLQQLVDGDIAPNSGGWQWACSVGTDAQPYFRIFNPISQSERYDPEGIYIRRYLPELEAVPLKYIHAPWTMPEDVQRTAGCIIGRDYPEPVVDHAVQRERALALFKAVRAIEQTTSTGDARLGDSFEEQEAG